MYFNTCLKFELNCTLNMTVRPVAILNVTTFFVISTCIHVYAVIGVQFIPPSVVIGFDVEDYTVNEDAGTVELMVSVQEGTIPAGVTRRVTLTTSDRTASCRPPLTVYTCTTQISEHYETHTDRCLVDPL